MKHRTLGHGLEVRAIGVGYPKRPGIDLFCRHRVDRDVLVEEAVGGMAELVEEGKVRSPACPRPNRWTVSTKLRRG